jgi:hypothetical protein
LSKRDARLKTFVKAEKLNLSKKPDPAPRVIQPRDPRYNVVVGPYLKPLEHKVYKAIAAVWGGPTVMKGFNAVEQGCIIRGMWDSLGDPIAISIDASRFDQHVSADALRWEHSVYNGVYKSPLLAKLLSWQVGNEGKAFTPEGVVTYSVAGCRMSGDMNTALGNCLLMCAMCHQLFEKLGIVGRLANNGDDCVLFVERRDAARLIKTIPKFFLGFGFTMKVEAPVDVFEKIEFCQTQPVYDGTTWRMVRSPRVCLDKDGINLRPGNRSFEGWLGSVGECGMALTSGIPILQSYYQYLIRVSNGKRAVLEVTGMEYLRGNLISSAPSSISDDARLSFWRAFGVQPHRQVLIEESLDELDSALPVEMIGPILSLPFLQHL